MRKIFLIMTVIMLFIPALAMADRSASSFKAFTSSGLIKNNRNPVDTKVYRITVVASSAAAKWALYDANVPANYTATTIKTEGAIAVQWNSQVYDFTDKPLELSTGSYLWLVGATAVVEYE